MPDLDVLEKSNADAPPNRVEKVISIGVGGLLLVLAVSLWVWGVRLGVAGLRDTAGWLPGLGKLLFPLALTSVFVGFGSWRMLVVALPQRIFGLTPGRLVLAVFVLGSVVGAVL